MSLQIISVSPSYLADAPGEYVLAVTGADRPTLYTLTVGVTIPGWPAPVLPCAIRPRQ